MRPRWLTCRSTTQKTLVVRGVGVGSYQLDHAPQGTMAVRLRLGSEVEFCAVAPAKTPASANDTTAKFVGVKNAPTPAIFPVVPQ